MGVDIELQERLATLEAEIGKLRQSAHEHNVRINAAFQLLEPLETESKSQRQRIALLEGRISLLESRELTQHQQIEAIDQFIQGFANLALQR